jgi:glutamine amidotransferase
MSNKNICLIDYGMGNIQSVINAFKVLEQDLIVSSSADDINKSDALILPGVGAFEKAMVSLKQLNIIDSIIENTKNKQKPFLGICLGMQLLAENSTEGKIKKGESTKGLGLIPGNVIKIDCKKDFALPHVGWNEVYFNNSCSLFRNIEVKPCFYFVHSFCFRTEKKFISSTTKYDVEVVASVQNGNIMGVQFHPEKSQRKGLKLLSNFISQI